MPRLIIEFNHEELNQLQFPVMIETWDKVMGCNRIKNKYNNQFSEQERQLIKRYYNIFYKWYLRTGTPQHHRMKPTTYQLLERAIQFFATQ
jgi:hypothetical protein